MDSNSTCKNVQKYTLSDRWSSRKKRKTKWKNLLNPQLDLLGVQFVRRKCYSYLHVLKKTPFHLRELLVNFSFQHRIIPFFVKGEFVNNKTVLLQLHSSTMCWYLVMLWVRNQNYIFTHWFLRSLRAFIHSRKAAA